MDWLVWYFIINGAMALIVYSGWDNVEKNVDMVDLYNQYGRKTTRIMMVIVFCLFGTLILVFGIVSALLGVIRSVLK